MRTGLGKKVGASTCTAFLECYVKAMPTGNRAAGVRKKFELCLDFDLRGVFARLCYDLAPPPAVSPARFFAGLAAGSLEIEQCNVYRCPQVLIRERCFNLSLLTTEAGGRPPSPCGGGLFALRRKFVMESLILAQNERWRHGLGMQVERSAVFES